MLLHERREAQRVQSNQHQREEELRSTVEKNACCFITQVFKFRRVGLLCEILCFDYVILEEVLKSVRLSIGEGEVVQHSDHIGRKVERKDREEVDELKNIEEVPHGFNGTTQKQPDKHIDQKCQKGEATDRTTS